MRTHGKSTWKTCQLADASCTQFAWLAHWVDVPVAQTSPKPPPGIHLQCSPHTQACSSLLRDFLQRPAGGHQAKCAGDGNAGAKAVAVQGAVARAVDAA